MRSNAPHFSKLDSLIEKVIKIVNDGQVKSTTLYFKQIIQQPEIIPRGHPFELKLTLNDCHGRRKTKTYFCRVEHDDHHPNLPNIALKHLFTLWQYHLINKDWFEALNDVQYCLPLCSTMQSRINDFEKNTQTLNLNTMESCFITAVITRTNHDYQRAFHDFKVMAILHTKMKDLTRKIDRYINNSPIHLYHSIKVRKKKETILSKLSNAIHHNEINKEVFLGILSNALSKLFEARSEASWLFWSHAAGRSEDLIMNCITAVESINAYTDMPNYQNDSPTLFSKITVRRGESRSSPNLDNHGETRSHEHLFRLDSISYDEA